MRTTFIILLTAALMSFTPKERNYVIKGSIVNVTDDNTISLSFFDPRLHAFVEQSSTVIIDSLFEFKGKLYSPTYARLNLPNDIKIPILLDNDTISIIGDLSQKKSITLKGNKENEKLNDQRILLLDLTDKLDNYTKEHTATFNEAKEKKDIVTQKKITKMYLELAKPYTAILNKYISEDTTFTAATALYNKIKIDDISYTKAQEHFNRLPNDIQHSNLGQAILDMINMNKSVDRIKEGDNAINATGKDTTGKQITLLDKKNTITIIHFWASWALSSRLMSDELNILYKNYKKNGLNIISVSLDKNRNDWVEAIKEDKMIWKHISNLQYWDEPIAKNFKIKSIPSLIIVNNKGVIIGLYNNTDEIENLLKEFYK